MAHKGVEMQTSNSCYSTFSWRDTVIRYLAFIESNSKTQNIDYKAIQIEEIKDLSLRCSAWKGFAPCLQW